MVEVGADVNATYGSNWQVGDRAQVIAAVPCGECYECHKGWMAVCQNQTSVGYQYDGGFAEFMIVPRQVLKVDGLNRIPDNVGYDEASAAEPFACAINAQELLGIEPGDTSSSSAPARSAACTSGSPAGCTRAARSTSSTSTPSAEDVGRRGAARRDHRRLAGGCRRAGDGADRGRGADVDHHRHPGQLTQEQAIAMAARHGRISFFGGLPKTDP